MMPLADRDSGVAGPQPVDQPAARDAEPLSRWGLAKRVLFRFACVYLLLYNLPFPLSHLPYGYVLTTPYNTFWEALVSAVAFRVFGIEITVLPNGSGDTTYNYVQIFCFLVLAILATALWSLLDRRRLQYERPHRWLRAYVRIVLAVTMLSYGAAKVIPTQFTSPSLDRLVQPFGDSSPMGILWTFMGVSATYTFFTGLAEMVGGLLLASRRTTLLGSLVSISVMSNVVMLNFCYDVPVKLYSSHLLAMAIFLALPDLRRLVDFFLLNRTVAPAEIRPLFARPWMNRGTLALRTLFIVGFAALSLYGSHQGRKMYGDLAPKPPLYGIWEVDEFVIDGEARPALVTDTGRWRRVVFTSQNSLSILLMSDSRRRYELKLDEKGRTLELTKRDDPAWKAAISYQRPEPERLALSGTFDGQKIQAKLRRAKEADFRLLSRGFHWINEYPFNR